MRINEAIGLFLLQLRANGRSVHTQKQYARHLALLRRMFREHRIEEVTHEDVAHFLVSPAATHKAKGGIKRDTSVNALRSSVRCFFNYAHAAGYMPANPARLVRRAICSTPKPRAVSETDCGKLLAALATARTRAELRDRVLFTVLLRVGLRVGSAVGLDISDVDLETGELRLRRMKGGAEDSALVPVEVVDLLRGYIGDRCTGPLFLAGHGDRMGARQIHRRLELWSERAGIKRRFGPHALRHTFALRVYAATGDVLVTARALCHRSVASTQVYARPDPAVVRAAIATSS